MEKYFEFEYNMEIWALIIAGCIVALYIVYLIIYFSVRGIIKLYKSHSDKYKYDPMRDEYVRKESKK